jgi:hypothetical protein
MSRSLSPPKYITPILLGVLGNRSDISKPKIQTELLPAIVAEFDHPPDHCYVSTDGLTSIYVQDWCERNNIPLTAIDADWRTLGRRARAIRDTRIQKEATHFLFFLSPRSDYYLTAATRLAKKGHTVFTYNATDDSLEELVVECEIKTPTGRDTSMQSSYSREGARGAARLPTPKPQAKTGRKGCTGKEQTLEQCLQKRASLQSGSGASP